VPEAASNSSDYSGVLILLTRPLVQVETLRGLGNQTENKMQPTRTELLEAWMTLIKVLDYYGPDYVDEYHKQVLPDVLSLLDKLQKDER